MDWQLVAKYVTVKSTDFFLQCSSFTRLQYGYFFQFVFALPSQRDIGIFAAAAITSWVFIYRKNSKNWDTLNYCRDCPTNGIVGFYSAILRSKDADRITNRVDTDQTAP